MNWTERELDLFKSKRQRGTAPPPALEFELHCLIADILKRWCYPSWRYTHIPLGEHRTPATAGRLKRMGVQRGFPDWLFISFRGECCWLELKRRGQKLTEAQEQIAKFLQDAGHKYLCTDNFNTALNWLRERGIVPARITQWSGQDNSNRSGAECLPEERAIES